MYPKTRDFYLFNLAKEAHKRNQRSRVMSATTLILAG